VSLAILFAILAVQPNSSVPPLIGPAGPRTVETAPAAIQPRPSWPSLADARSFQPQMSPDMGAYGGSSLPGPIRLPAAGFAADPGQAVPSDDHGSYVSSSDGYVGGDCATCGGAARSCHHLWPIGRLRGFCHDPLVKARCRAFWGGSPGDMYPWSPCWAECDTNYYFRPYYWKQIGRQQAAAAAWGADPSSPYTSTVMETVYSEMDIPDVDRFEQLPPPTGRKERPSQHFESVGTR
jgi:hypothetical protein